MMKDKNKLDLVKISERYKKIKSDEMPLEKFERKSYQTNLRKDQARRKFKLNTKMTRRML